MFDPGKKIPKKIAKKFKKIKKPLSGFISIQNGLREAEKEKKKISPEFCSYSTRARKFQKKIAKKFKKLKKLIPALFLSKTG